MEWRMSMHSRDHLEAWLRNEIMCKEKLFNRAVRQVILLNNKIIALKVRYDRAREKQQRAMRYSYRLQLASYEGVRNMYYRYASIKSDEIEDLQDLYYDTTGSQYEFDLESDSEDMASLELLTH